MKSFVKGLIIVGAIAVAGTSILSLAGENIALRSEIAQQRQQSKCKCCTHCQSSGDACNESTCTGEKCKERPKNASEVDITRTGDNLSYEKIMQPNVIADHAIVPSLKYIKESLGNNSVVFAEIGTCGGFLTSAFSKKLDEMLYIAVEEDCSDRASLKAHLRAQGLQSSVVVYRDSAQLHKGNSALPECDIIFLFRQLSTVTDPIGFLRDLIARNSIRRGGRLIVMEPATNETLPPAFQVRPNPILRSEVVRYCETAGFSLIDAIPYLPRFHLLVFSAPSV